jgi:spermidine synthase
MFWKILGGRCIYQTPHGVKVHQNAKYRWLTNNSDSIQSIINRRHPEKPVLLYAIPLSWILKHQLAKTCLLGLGGAGIVHALAPYLNEELIAVENDAEMIAIAKQYFRVDELKQLKIIHQDAFEFVKSNRENYQHLLIDLFNATNFPAHCSTPSFFSHCWQLLQNEGIMAVNIANPDEVWPLFLCIRECFSQHTVIIPIENCANFIVLAIKSTSIAGLLERLQTIPQLKKLSWDSHWGCLARF